MHLIAKSKKRVSSIIAVYPVQVLLRNEKPWTLRNEPTQQQALYEAVAYWPDLVKSIKHTYTSVQKW